MVSNQTNKKHKLIIIFSLFVPRLHVLRLGFSGGSGPDLPPLLSRWSAADQWLMGQCRPDCWHSRWPPRPGETERGIDTDVIIVVLLVMFIGVRRYRSNAFTISQNQKWHLPFVWENYLLQIQSNDPAASETMKFFDMKNVFNPKSLIFLIDLCTTGFSCACINCWIIWFQMKHQIQNSSCVFCVKIFICDETKAVNIVNIVQFTSLH